MRPVFPAVLLALLALPAPGGEVEDLVKALGDDDYEVRERALQRLTEIGDPAVPALRAATKSTDAEVRAKASRALACIEWRTALPKAFLEKHPDAVGGILGADDESLVRWLQLLGSSCPGAEAVPAASRFLEFPSARVRKDALLLISRRSAALRGVRDEAALARALPFLSDPDPGLRVLALSVAGEWGRRDGAAEDRLAETVRRSVVPAALSALGAADGTVRAAAARALGRIADPAAVERLCEGAVDPVSAVRIASLEALGLIGDRRGARVAAAALTDPGTDVVRAAIDACGRMKAMEAAPAIREAMAAEGRAPILRQAALEVLEVLAPPAEEDARRFLADTNAVLRAVAWRIVLAARPQEGPLAAKDEEAEVRLVAAAALTRAPRDAAVPALLSLLDDDRAVTLRNSRGEDLMRGEVREVAIASLEKATGRASQGADTDARVEGWKAWAAGGGR
ncbi:MAG: HEAT repeat domain-containing protein [Planctomycetia bacterium]|nr:HEAT repeat domain-containing protein [Planctomycetia bacterium]